jgi:hypothetical protein
MAGTGPRRLPMEPDRPVVGGARFHGGELVCVTAESVASRRLRAYRNSVYLDK